MSCGVGCRYSSDLVLLWLWCRAVATTRIQPLAWEPPYAEGVALKRQKIVYFQRRSRSSAEKLQYIIEEKNELGLDTLKMAIGAAFKKFFYYS